MICPGGEMPNYQLISSDSHVKIPDEAWQQYLDPEFRSRAPRIERTEEGAFRIFEGNRTPVRALDNLAGKRPEEFSLNVRRMDEQRPGAWDPEARLKDMDIDGVDAEILFFGGPLVTKDRRLHLNSVRGYHRWLTDFCSPAPRRLLGMAVIPIDTPEIAVEEIRYVRRAGLVGGMIPLFPPEGDYGDRKWDPMWEAFVDAGLPVALHTGSRRPGTPEVRLFDSSARFMTGLVMNKMAVAEALSELIHGLVMQRYPDLRFVAVEAQVGWISFVLYYMDHLWEKHRYWTKSPLEHPPSTYFHRQVVATFMEDPVGLREYQHIGVDNIMWASDYPHSETTWPNSKKLTDGWFEPFPPEDREKILWRNCARVFSLL
jgi:predicted TIM-barrel fold metal-dependent hydrolase